MTRIVGALRGRQRQVYEIIRAGGPITQRAIHEALGMKSETVSLTDFIRPLGAAGLIRAAGDTTPATPAKLWEAVPAAEVEDAQKVWRQRGAATPKQRLADLRSIRQLVPGSHAEFYTARDRMLSLIALLTRMPEMMFWDAAEGEDLADIDQSILEMEID